MDPGPVDPEPRPSPGARGSRPGRFPQGFAWKTHRGALSPGSPRVSTVPLFYHSKANRPPNDHAHQNTPRPGRPGARGAALAQELRVGGRHARRRRTEGTAATQPAPPAPGRPPAARALTRGAPAVLPTTRRSRWGGRRRRGHVLAQQQLSKNAASSSAYLKRSRAASCQQGPGLTRFSTQQLWGNPPSPLLGERTRRRQGINAGCWVGRRRGRRHDRAPTSRARPQTRAPRQTGLTKGRQHRVPRAAGAPVPSSAWCSCPLRPPCPTQGHRSPFRSALPQWCPPGANGGSPGQGPPKPQPTVYPRPSDSQTFENNSHFPRRKAPYICLHPSAESAHKRCTPEGLLGPALFKRYCSAKPKKSLRSRLREQECRHLGPCDSHRSKARAAIWPTVSMPEVGGLSPDVALHVAPPNMCAHPQTTPEGERPFIVVPALEPQPSWSS